MRLTKKQVSLLSSLLIIIIVTFFPQTRSFFEKQSTPPNTSQLVTKTPSQTVLSTHETPGKTEGVVTKVVDGDTIQITDRSGKHTVRLIGINTPETVDPRKTLECFGKEASAKAKTLLTGQQVLLESDPTQDDKDKYGRLLRYVFLPDGTNVNLAMIKEGYAYEYTYDVPYTYQTEFKKAQQDAMTQNLGLWNTNTCNGKK